MPTSHVNPVVSTVPPAFVQQRIGTTAARFALNSMLMPRTDSGLTYIDQRSGVMAAGDGDTTHLGMKVAAGSGMAVTVNQGHCVINTSGQGAYTCCLDSQKTVTIPTSSPTTNRYDLVCATVYDDNNSVINSSAGTRQFTVELIQGDGVSGVPTIPTAGVGQIPLASVYVPANASVVTGTDPNTSGPRVNDLRGPGLVARGGMRALYGADSRPSSTAFAQPGSYPGEVRWVHNSLFQHQVYYGSSTGWRGVHNCLVYNANPTTVGWVGSFTVGQVNEICRVHIPYPGTPFMIYPSARSLFQQGPGTSVDLRITLDSYNGSSAAGTLVSWNRHDCGNTNANTLQGLNVAPMMYGPFTAATDVVMSHMLWASVSGNTWGFNFAGSQTTDNLLSVNVYPSTVQPPTQ